jgi:hypothetical protein
MHHVRLSQRCKLRLYSSEPMRHAELSIYTLRRNMETLRMEAACSSKTARVTMQYASGSEILSGAFTETQNCFEHRTLLDAVLQSQQPVILLTTNLNCSNGYATGRLRLAEATTVPNSSSLNTCVLFLFAPAYDTRPTTTPTA